MQKIIVQKFGGTSVSTEEYRQLCIQKIHNEIREYNKVVVVVSAMGRLGDPYSTDTLLSLSPSISGREKDLLMNAGETISACVFSEELFKSGINNCVLTGGQAGIETNDNFNNATIEKVLPDRIYNELKTKDVVVVTGFQGKTKDGEVTTLGRGGSDTSAVALGVGLNADRVDVFTDVEGIMTTDPKIVDEAMVIKEASYNEILNLTYSGARIIHPRAVELAMKHNLKVMVRSTFSNNGGTLIHNEVHGTEDLESKETLFTGITNKNGLSRFEIQADRVEQKHIFAMMKKSSISLDMIKVSGSKVNFIVDDIYDGKITKYLLDNKIEFSHQDKLSKIALVGEKISGVSGVMGNVVDILYENDIDIIDTTDSNTTLWFLISETDVEKSLCALHHHLFQKQ